MNDSDFPGNSSESDQDIIEDLNKRYNLNIIGPILWSLILTIVVFGEYLN